MTKKFIEEEFPIVELSIIGRKEKSSWNDNIISIHPWWARRPTTIVRGLILASLINYPPSKKERNEISSFIINICSNYKKIPNQINITKKIKEIIKNEGSDQPKILLDAFAGGGAIPLEAARLGLKSYGIDLNPVAVLIEKATCEFFQKYKNDLIIEIKKWWNHLRNKLNRELGDFYVNPVNNNNKILAFLWVRQIKCSNSKCSAIIPMLSSYKIVNKKNKKVYLKEIIEKDDENNNKISFSIKTDNKFPLGIDKNKIFSKGKVTCPACGITISNPDTMDLVKKKQYEDKLLVVVEKNSSNNKNYRLSTEKDNEIIRKVKQKLNNLSDFIPKEKLPKDVRRWQIQNYGILSWKELFNDRQLIFSIIYSKELKILSNKIYNSYNDKEFSKAIMLFLSFTLSRVINYNSKFAHWQKKAELLAQTWSRIGLFMNGSYPEINPFVDFSGNPERYLKFLESISGNNLNFTNLATIKQGNAMNLEFENNSVDLIITDPPYYDAMLYANPSDFFYIWLKKTLEDIFPELFLFSLTPKKEEIIQSRFRHNNNIKEAIRFYENSMIKVLKEFRRILKPNGVGVIMYTHKSVTAWEVLINAIIESNLIISSAWPIGTEKRGGLREENKVSLSSSISLVFRKMKKEKEIFFETEFKKILENELREKLRNLLVELEMYGSDFFISAIGFSLNIFTRYKKVISQKTGEQVPVSLYLDLVRKIVNEFLLGTVLERDLTQNLDEITNLYIIWCWFFRNNGIDLDDALKLAQSFGVGELNDLRKNKIIKLDNRKFKLLLASDKTREDYLIKNKDSLTTLIDNLHLLAILWKNNDKNLDEEVKKVEIEYSENIWKVGQALAEFFPTNHNEHNYLQGLLARYGKTKSKSDLKKWI